MDLFKKRKIDEKTEQLAQAQEQEQQLQLQAQPLTVPPPEVEKPLETVEPKKSELQESEDLIVARKNAEDQIRLIETRIAAQREAWPQKAREKEEENISLQAQLEMLVRQSEQERNKRENQLNALQKQIQSDLSEVEKALENEIAVWNERLSSKEKETEETRHRSIFDETQKKIEAEQSVRTLYTELEKVESKYKGMERQLLEEQNQWISKIKAREDEISALRTQISLREAQMRMDMEKSIAIKTEMESAWQSQEQELKSKLEAHGRDFSKVYHQKEEELIAFRSAMERRLSSDRLDNEKKEKEVRDMSLRLEERIKAVESSLETERAGWQEMLKKREEELNQLKVQLMLQESQEKADREKKYQEFKEAETIANKRLKEIRQKIEEEKTQWARATSVKDEELKVFKIQSELKLKELRDSWEKRKAGAEQEKSALLEEIAGLEKKFSAQKQNLQNELDAKNTEIITYQKECHEKQAQMLDSEQRSLAELKQKKDELEKELLTIKTNFSQEKSHWQEIVSQKEREVSAAKNEFAARESSISRELAARELLLKNELAPAAARLDEGKAKIKDFMKRSADEMLRKETQKKAIQEQYKKQEESIRLRTTAITEKIKANDESYKQKIEEIRAQIETQSGFSATALAKLREEEELVSSELAREKEKSDSQKKALDDEFASQAGMLRLEIETLEKEYIQAEEKLKIEISAKTKELEEEEKRAQALDEKGRRDLAAKEQEFAALKNDGEAKIAALTSELSNARADFNKKVKAKEAQVSNLNEALKENEQRFNDEFAALKEELESNISPLLLSRAELVSRIESEKKNAEDAIASCDSRIAVLNEEQQKKELEFNMAQSELKEKLANEKNNVTLAFEALGEERAREQAEHSRKALILEEEYKTLEKEIAARAEFFIAQKGQERESARAIAEKYKTEIAQSEEALARFEKEYPQQLSAKSAEIASLEKQIRTREVFYKEQQEQAEKGLENFQNRGQRRIAQARLAIGNVSEKHKSEMLIMQDKMSALSAEMELKEKNYREEFAREGKIFAEEKYKLEKQKSDLEEKINDISITSKENLRQRDKEILALQTELAEKETLWEQSWKHKEQEISAEKTILVQELSALSSRLKEEEDLSRRHLAEKESEITHFQNQYSTRLRDLAADIADKKRAREDANARLGEQVNLLTENMNNLKNSWEEARDAKEKELSVLKSNLEFWELRTKTEEEKRIAVWEEEKSTLESNIKETENTLNRVCGDCASRMEEKEKALEQLKLESVQNEEEKQAQWKEADARLAAERESLLGEISGWERKIKEESAKIEKDRKDIDRNLERLKLENALKDTESQAGKHRFERDLRKSQGKLEERLLQLKGKLAEEREAWTDKLRIKDEEIKTLNVRLAMRDDRYKSEVKRRQDELEKTIAALSEELKAVKNKYTKKVPHVEQLIEQKSKELEDLRRETEEKEIRIKDELNKRQAAHESITGKITDGLDAMEQELLSEGNRLEKLFAIKEQQIKKLNAFMIEKENTIIIERGQSKNIIDNLRVKAAQFRQSLSETINEGNQKTEASANSLFDDAIRFYSGGDYAAAQDVLEKILESRPLFAGAYQYLALCQCNLGNTQGAIRAAERALELEPHNEQLKEWIKNLK